MKTQKTTIRGLRLAALASAIPFIAAPILAAPALAAPAPPNTMRSQIKLGSMKPNVQIVSMNPVVYMPKADQAVSFPFTVQGRGPKKSLQIVALLTYDASGKAIAAAFGDGSMLSNGRWQVVFNEDDDYKLGTGYTHAIQVTEINGRRDDDDYYNKTRFVPVTLVRPLSERLPNDINKRTKGQKVIKKPVGPGPVAKKDTRSRRLGR
jgi:hypothetical protein